MRIKDFPPELRDLAILRYKECEIYKLRRTGRIYNVADIIPRHDILEDNVFNLFTWSETPEGGTFWSIVHDDKLDEAREMPCYPKSGSNISDKEFYDKYWI